MDIPEISQSSIKKLVAKDVSAQDKELFVQEIGNERMTEGGKSIAGELDKSKEQIEIINLLNEASDNVLVSLGLPKFTIPIENTHIFKDFENEDGTSADKRGEFSSINQRIMVAEGRNLLEFANFVCHELVHFKSYGVMQIASDEEEEMIVDSSYRSGFGANSRDSKQGFFRLIDEALTEIVSKRIIEDLKRSEPFVLAQEIAKTNLANQQVPPGERDKFVFVEELPQDHSMRESGKTVIASEYSYPFARAALDILIKKLYEKDHEYFSSEEAVLGLFLKGKFQGNFLQIARRIDQTFGKGTFRRFGQAAEDSGNLMVFVQNLQ